jgi:DNA-binding PadR family transcriptional regulator
MLGEQPLHGYEIIQRIGERSGGAWQPSPGSVYPALQLLEDEGLIRAEPQDGRRVFHLTDAGRAHVAERRDQLTAAWNTMSGGVNEGVREVRDLFEHLGAALREVVHVGTAAQITAARELLANTRRGLYRILAEDETTTGDDRA